MERDETDGNVDQFPSLQTCFVRQNVTLVFFRRATFTAWCTGYIFAGVYRICASGRGVLPGISPLLPCQKSAAKPPLPPPPFFPSGKVEEEDAKEKHSKCK